MRPRGGGDGNRDGRVGREGEGEGEERQAGGRESEEKTRGASRRTGAGVCGGERRGEEHGP